MSRTSLQRKKVAVIGGGWSGMAAAVAATQRGHRVTVFEASRTLGGRARAVQFNLSDGGAMSLDNGQHILIGAYAETLRLMRLVGVDPAAQLLRLPLTLKYPDGSGLALPDWLSPFDVLGGIWRNRSWGWRDKWSLLRAAGVWQLQGFRCLEHVTVRGLCAGLTPRVVKTLIEPLCVSALNTPSDRASGQVFLRVLKDSLLGKSAGMGANSNLLLPRTDLSALFPQAAATWLEERDSPVYTGTRVESLTQVDGNRWQVHSAAGEALFDAVVLAASASASAQLVVQSAAHSQSHHAQTMQRWANLTQALQFEEIATVYAHAPELRLPQPMLALNNDATNPAQFVFDKGQLGGPTGLLAFVISANTTDRQALQQQVIAQGTRELGDFLKGRPLSALQTIVEKRATFACTPGLQRPGAHIAPGLLACGDYVVGPYPATLEGAVRSGVCAGRSVLENLA